ncbi:hypothetical protein OF83DRAFT_1159793 [Amylostereum chailletii]|nr:hypothetical protein OF83DRAFT_1159793 [Amylostereum chailletii]
MQSLKADVPLQNKSDPSTVDPGMIAYIRTFRNPIVAADNEELLQAPRPSEIDIAQRMLNILPLESLVEAAHTGQDARLKVELGLRQYSGWGIAEDRSAAVALWRAVATDDWLRAVGGMSAPLAARYLCMYHRDAFGETKDAHHLRQCMHWAERAAMYVSPRDLQRLQEIIVGALGAEEAKTCMRRPAEEHEPAGGQRARETPDGDDEAEVRAREDRPPSQVHMRIYVQSMIV